ncbi:MAG: DUF3500 domain-containing protein [Janthinobacterium lividum]
MVGVFERLQIQNRSTTSPHENAGATRNARSVSVLQQVCAGLLTTKVALITLAEAWVNDTDSTTSAALLASYESDASLAQTYVGYAGTGELASQGDYIRVDAPHVWIKFVVQEGVVFRASYHLYSIWRDKTADYGGDFLSR